ncbi:T6SS phospholipase effector Tle1-like catalytic domain-containing protein [Piscinibacter terrae]|uniref:DUF2235 domain-containing protein n=1 Tax=Piscinibacter terrae TaxID=2496871 RepID=A0A3N7HSE7_9BURK|nr:DUF2235 domain-containing protein [Albitalea terrae]RQP23751.1 DUF2235 domain-containing protein [Albitalea terrae]
MASSPFKVRRISDVGLPETSVRKATRAALELHADLVENCKTCPKPVWFTAFFDGTGNNFTVDGFGQVDPKQVKYSNVAKLAQFAHCKNAPSSRTAFQYIEGVGTPCNKEGVSDSGKGMDNTLGMSAAAKGEARIRWMMRELKKHVDQHMPFVNQINIAVFGFSRGATQARAFVRMLGEEMGAWDGQSLLWNQAGLDGKHPRVVVYFLGIFDTVSSTGFGGSKGETVAKYVAPAAATVLLPGGIVIGPAAGGVLHEIDEGGHAAWAHDLTITPYVDRCVHFVAGHEVREKFPSDSIRRNKDLPANSVELVYPGMHSDVGGGYGWASPSYQEGRSNELARIPLCHMFIEAYKAGVPLDPPDAVLKRAGTLFDISEELERTYWTYMGPAPSWAMESLETAVVWHMQHYYEWRESRRRRLNDGRLKIAVQDKYMEMTDKDWADDVQNIAESQTGYFRSQIGVQQHAIYDAYKHKLMDTMKPQERADFDLFFDRYVHDSIAGFKQQMIEAWTGLRVVEASRWSINRKYFMGKRGKRFLYWRYESDGTAYAGVRFDDNDVDENYDSEEARRARQGALEAREFQWTR